MRNAEGKIIYIGKAKKLKNRVSQYFGSQNRHSEKVLRMVSNVKDFDYILCDSEFEALVLECSLIKQYRPKYNILLKDDKGYQYIRITKGDWPDFEAVKRKEEDGAKYLGPYTSSYSVTQAVERAKKVFMLPTCRLVFPRDIGKSRPCLNYHIGLCSAPCAGRVSQQEYYENFSRALRYLEGGGEESISDLTDEMNQAADELDFERAARIRDRIAALRRVAEKQKVVCATVPFQDVFGFADNGKECCVSVMSINEGALYGTQSFFFESGERREELLASFVTEFYSVPGQKIPPQITVGFLPEGDELLEKWLSDQAGRQVRFHLPQRGDRLGLREMADKNAAEHLLHREAGAKRTSAPVEELGKLLGMKYPPEYIEAYDISNTAGAENVAAMVVFRDGKPLKKAYRYFKIKGFDGQNDTASMKEVIERRLDEYLKLSGNGETEGFARLPDLILLDGGAGQLSAALEAMDGRGISVPAYGMVKDDHHKTRAIVSESGEIEIKRTRSVFTLVSSIQDEVHRSAVDYHHKRMNKKTFSSSLLEIEGIGEARAKALLKELRTLTAVKKASVEELAAVKGMNKAAARRIYDFYHAEK